MQDEEESIMISEWPVFKEEWNFASDEKAIETIKEAVRGIRNVRTQMNVALPKMAAKYASRIYFAHLRQLKFLTKLFVLSDDFIYNIDSCSIII